MDQHSEDAEISGDKLKDLDTGELQEPMTEAVHCPDCDSPNLITFAKGKRFKCMDCSGFFNRVSMEEYFNPSYENRLILEREKTMGKPHVPNDKITGEFLNTRQPHPPKKFDPNQVEYKGKVKVKEGVLPPKGDAPISEIENRAIEIYHKLHPNFSIEDLNAWLSYSSNEMGEGVGVNGVEYYRDAESSGQCKSYRQALEVAARRLAKQFDNFKSFEDFFYGDEGGYSSYEEKMDKYAVTPDNDKADERKEPWAQVEPRDDLEYKERTTNSKRRPNMDKNRKQEAYYTGVGNGKEENVDSPNTKDPFSVPSYSGDKMGSKGTNPNQGGSDYADSTRNRPKNVKPKQPAFIDGPNIMGSTRNRPKNVKPKQPAFIDMGESRIDLGKVVEASIRKGMNADELANVLEYFGFPAKKKI